MSNSIKPKQRPGEDHYAYSRRIIGENPSSPCTAHTMTFGERCLRCGWEHPTPPLDWRARALAAEACARGLDAAVALLQDRGAYRPYAVTAAAAAVDRWTAHRADYDTLDQAQADALRQCVRNPLDDPRYA